MWHILKDGKSISMHLTSAQKKFEARTLTEFVKAQNEDAFATERQKIDRS